MVRVTSYHRLSPLYRASHISFVSLKNHYFVSYINYHHCAHGVSVSLMYYGHGELQAMGGDRARI